MAEQWGIKLKTDRMMLNSGSEHEHLPLKFETEADAQWCIDHVGWLPGFRKQLVGAKPALIPSPPRREKGEK